MEPVPRRGWHGEAHAPGRGDARRRQQGDGVPRAQRQRARGPGHARRVLAAMAELDYTPSDAARRLSLGRTLTISVVTSFLTRPQAAERLRGVDAVLSDSEFDLVIYNVETVEKRDQYLQHLALAQRTDGLLVISLPPRPEDVVASVVRGDPGRGHRCPRTGGRRACPMSSATTSPVASSRRATCSSSVTGRSPSSATSSRTPSASPPADTASWATSAPSRAPASRRRAELVALGAHSRYEARELAARMLALGRSTDGHLRRQRHPGPGRHLRGARRGHPRPRRPVGHRLRRHRDGRLHRAHDRSASSSSSRDGVGPSCSCARSSGVRRSPPRSS